LFDIIVKACNNSISLRTILSYHLHLI